MNIMTLTDFLLARIAEDEAVARPLANADTRSGLRESSREYVEATPARVLAECEAKRRIVERCAPLDDMQVRRQTRALAGDALRLLALPYADHEDFQPEWRPGQLNDAEVAPVSEQTITWLPTTQAGDTMVIRDADTGEVVFRREITEAEAAGCSLGIPVDTLQTGTSYTVQVERDGVDVPTWSPSGVFEYRELP